MSERTHPSESRLAGYATGALPEAPAIAVSAHLEACAACRARVAGLEDAEGRLMASLPPTPLAPAALDQALARIDAAPDLEPAGPRRDTLDDIRLPGAVAHVGLGARRWLAPGLWAAPVRAPPADGWRVFLLRAPAGTRLPTHGHHGGEMIAVLSGALREERRLQAGDFAESFAQSEHELTVENDGPCVCLVAIQGPVRWRGWARMITPLLGI